VDCRRKYVGDVKSDSGVERNPEVVIDQSRLGHSQGRYSRTFVYTSKHNSICARVDFSRSIHCKPERRIKLYANSNIEYIPRT
jgi:hypothetical protein